MLSPLGMDEETWKKRNLVSKKTYKKYSAWRKGYSAGKEGKRALDNPYLKQLDRTLMVKAARWEIGRELATFNAAFRDKRLSKLRKEAEALKRKQAKKEKRWQEKHKHDKHKKRKRKKHGSRKR